MFIRCLYSSTYCVGHLAEPSLKLRYISSYLTIFFTFWSVCWHSDSQNESDESTRYFTGSPLLKKRWQLLFRTSVWSCLTLFIYFTTFSWTAFDDVKMDNLSLRVCSHWATPRTIYVARPMKWLKLANSISGRVSVHITVVPIIIVVGLSLGIVLGVVQCWQTIRILSKCWPILQVKPKFQSVLNIPEDQLGTAFPNLNDDVELS